MKTYNEVFEEIKNSVSASASGKKKKTFSRADFDKLTKAYLNDVNASTEVCSLKGGELEKKTVAPVKLFRGMLKKILIDFGVDKAEAESIESDAYSISNVDGMYEIISECITNYCDADKKFDFLTKEDFKASVTIENIPEGEAEYAGIKRPDGTMSDPSRIKTKAHRKMEKKSKAPDWLKEKFKK